MVTVFGILVYVVLQVRRENSQSLVLARDALGNEALVLEGTLAGHARTLFMIDTAYAGAPVLSTSYLAVQHSCGRGILSTEAKYRQCVHALRNEVREDDRYAAVDTLLRAQTCRAYTSGCTQRLMGIGSTVEAQADMLLCDGIRFGMHKTHNVDADVFVTHPLHGSVHILTCDYLLHRAPCVIRPAARRLHLNVSPMHPMRAGFEFHEAEFVGGAFVVPMRVGGADLKIVVDTGAAAAISLGRSAVDKVATCAKPLPATRALQSGVNGERVCSDVLTASVQIGGLHMGNAVEVFANADEVEGADGYAGMGLLRMVDLWLQPNAIGFRFSGLPSRRTEAVVEGDCGRPAPKCVKP